MTDHTIAVSGGDTTPGGAESKDHDEVVPRNTYVKAIDEVKAVKRRLQEAEAKKAEYEANLKAIEEAKLLEEKRHLELIDQLKADKEKLALEVNTHIQDKNDFRKMNAMLGIMQQKGIQLEPQYYGLLPIDKVGFDEDGNLDNTSIASAVDEFQKTHPRLTLPLAKLLPNDKSGSGGQKISVDEWKKLGPVERKKALDEGRVKLPV